MSCPSEIELIQMIAGELDDRRAKAVTEHARSCARCAALLKSQSVLWETLVDLDAAESPDLWERIETGLDRKQTVPFPTPGSRQFGLLRVAASLAFAALLGIAAGRLIPVSQESSSTASVSTETPLEVLGADDLLVDAATRLPLTVADDLEEKAEGAS
ncbi:MAG: hypothetical protein J5J06_12485 [Phycisphaerae bacterium]|nr:hypothetical protein [Phycisphaerae bacterium]